MQLSAAAAWMRPASRIQRGRLSVKRVGYSPPRGLRPGDLAGQVGRVLAGYLLIAGRPSATPCSILSLASQLPSVPSQIPRSRATWAIGFPVSRTIRTAPRGTADRISVSSPARLVLIADASSIRGKLKLRGLPGCGRPQVDPCREIDLVLADDRSPYASPLVARLERLHQTLTGWVIPRIFIVADGNPPPIMISAPRRTWNLTSRTVPRGGVHLPPPARVTPREGARLAAAMRAGAVSRMRCTGRSPTPPGRERGRTQRRTKERPASVSQRGSIVTG